MAQALAMCRAAMTRPRVGLKQPTHASRLTLAMRRAAMTRPHVGLTDVPLIHATTSAMKCCAMTIRPHVGLACARHASSCLGHSC